MTAVELDKPKGMERIRWNLLTTRFIESPEDAVKCVGVYVRSWGFEEFYRVFRHWCKVERIALRDLDHIQRAIGVEEIVARSFMLRHKLGREQPELPPEAAFDDLEVVALGVFSKKIPKIRKLGEADRLVAGLGGHPGHKSGGESGYETCGMAPRWSQTSCLFSRPPGGWTSLRRRGPQCP